MSKININGVVREMTPEEVEQLKSHLDDFPPEGMEEKVERLTAFMERIQAALSKLGILTDE